MRTHTKKNLHAHNYACLPSIIPPPCPPPQVTAVAYDNPIPGFQTNNTINLRLWAAKPDREFDLQAFNTGDYVQVGGRPKPHDGQQSRQAL